MKWVFLIKEFINLKLQNKYWFVFLTCLFLVDTLIGNSYYLFVPNCDTEDQWATRIAYYCMAKGVTGSFLYFYIAWSRNHKPPKMDAVDGALAVLCGVVSVFSAVRVLFGALFISDAWYWGLFIPFYIILWAFRYAKR